MLKQPLSVLEGDKGDELEEIALQLFYTIQQHAGIYKTLQKSVHGYGRHSIHFHTDLDTAYA